MNLFSKLREKSRIKAEIKKIKKSQKRASVLEKKIKDVTISVKELDEYYRLTEDIKKMVEKFDFVNGQLVPKNDAAQTDKVDQNNTEQPVAKQQQAQQQAQVPQGSTPEEVQQKELERKIEMQKRAEHMRAQRDANIKQQQEQLRQQQLRAQHQAHLAQQQAQHQAQQQAVDNLTPEEQQELKLRQWFARLTPEQQQAYIAQQQQQQAQQQYEQQQAYIAQQQQQAQHQAQPEVEDRIIGVFIFAKDMPELMVRIKISDLNNFKEYLDESKAKGQRINIGGFDVYANSISGFKVVELEQQ